MAGGISNASQFQKLRIICPRLKATSSYLDLFTTQGSAYDSVIEVITVHSSSRNHIGFLNFPDVLQPFDDDHGYDYWKIFANEIDGDEARQSNAYAEWGIDKHNGALVVVRPDQHVSIVCALDEMPLVDQLFAKLLLDQHEKWAVGVYACKDTAKSCSTINIANCQNV
jgi:phenol 2-monooxygenase